MPTPASAGGSWLIQIDDGQALAFSAGLGALSASSWASSCTRLVSAAGAKKMSYRVYTPYDDQCNTIMGTELTNCIEQGKDPQQALTDAQKTAESQIVIKS